MIARRDFLTAAACVAAGGAAFALKPHRRVSLLGHAKLQNIVPASFGEWNSVDVGDLVAPKAEGGLAAKLYDEMVGRIYSQTPTGAQVMMLLAHGDTESDELQLHRPETCYPAFGFEISQSARGMLPLSGSVQLPVRRLVASAPGRQENILYWSRLGEYFPVDGIGQRLDRLRTSMGGYVADGLLARFSAMGSDPKEAFTLVDAFVPALLKAVHADARRALIGTHLAVGMAGSGA
jgi:EpsI family protein